VCKKGCFFCWGFGGGGSGVCGGTVGVFDTGLGFFLVFFALSVSEARMTLLPIMRRRGCFWVFWSFLVVCRLVVFEFVIGC